jgi:hypothetical protein
VAAIPPYRALKGFSGVAFLSTPASEEGGLSDDEPGDGSDDAFWPTLRLLADQTAAGSHSPIEVAAYAA